MVVDGVGLEGSVSMGLMQATLGVMKSFSVSVDRMADMVEEVEGYGGATLRRGGLDWCCLSCGDYDFLGRLLVGVVG